MKYDINIHSPRKINLNAFQTFEDNNRNDSVRSILKHKKSLSIDQKDNIDANDQEFK